MHHPNNMGVDATPDSTGTGPETEFRSGPS